MKAEKKEKMTDVYQWLSYDTLEAIRKDLESYDKATLKFCFTETERKVHSKLLKRIKSDLKERPPS